MKSALDRNSCNDDDLKPTREHIACMLADVKDEQIKRRAVMLRERLPPRDAAAVAALADAVAAAVAAGDEPPVDDGPVVWSFVYPLADVISLLD